MVAEPRRITREEELANWEELYSALKKSTPSSPDWFQIIDACVGVLMAEKIEQLKAPSVTLTTT